MDNDTFESLSPWRAIWNISWPMVVMMFFHFLIGFVDVYVAGKLSTEVQASLGLITACLFFLLIIAISVSHGTVAAIGQSMGARKYKRVGRYVWLCLFLGVIFGAVICGLGLGLKEVLLDLIQVPDEIRDKARYFLKVYLLTLPPYYVLVSANAVFRAEKEVRIPMYAMSAILVVNIIGDFVFGLGLLAMPRLEHKGLAWATFFSVFAGAVVDVIFLSRRGLLDKASIPPLRWCKVAAAYLVKVAWPAGLMQTLWQTGFLALFAVTAALPHDPVTAMAAFTAGLRVESLLFLPGFALNMSASVLVGHYLGAGKFGEAKGFARRILIAGVAIISAVSVLVWFFSWEAAALLSPAEPVQAETVSYLSYNLIAIPFTLVTMILGGVFVGAGATLYNMWIFGSVVWLFRLPTAYVFGHMVWENASGIWFAQMCSMMLQAAIMVWVFERKDWSRFSMYAKKNRSQAASLRSTAAISHQK